MGWRLAALLPTQAAQKVILITLEWAACDPKATLRGPE